MTPTYKESASDREILLVGPYLGLWLSHHFVFHCLVLRSNSLVVEIW
jgi:hypothetical protein